MIHVEQVSKRFGSTLAVDNVSFQASQGRIFGLLGPNGAGKTTTIRMINHILDPDAGQILVEGIQAGPQTQKRIGYMPEERGLYKKMKVGEQLMYLSRLKGMSREAAREKILHWLDRFEARDWVKKPVGELSKGMSQKIQFISTIVHEPAIYIFDEPFSGLDPINSELLKDVILELRDNGSTVLFSTHRMEQVEQMCDDICLFNRGKAVLSGRMREIKSSFGTNTILIGFDGPVGFLDGLDHVRVNNRSANFAEIRFLEGADPQAILRKALETVRVTRFEIVEPSLTEIFISTVGKTSGAMEGAADSNASKQQENEQ